MSFPIVWHTAVCMQQSKFSPICAVVYYACITKLSALATHTQARTSWSLRTVSESYLFVDARRFTMKNHLQRTRLTGMRSSKIIAIMENRFRQ